MGGGADGISVFRCFGFFLGSLRASAGSTKQETSSIKCWARKLAEVLSVCNGFCLGFVQPLSQPPRHRLQQAESLFFHSLSSFGSWLNLYRHTRLRHVYAR